MNASDIDDTLLSVLFDTRYPELTVYPGVHQFVHEVQRLSLTEKDLERQSDDTDDTDDENLLKRASRLVKDQRITFLTARPEILRKRSTRELRACGFTNFTRTWLPFFVQKPVVLDWMVVVGSHWCFLDASSVDGQVGERDGVEAHCIWQAQGMRLYEADIPQPVRFLTHSCDAVLSLQQNFTRFKRIFAEHRFIFVGDNGQGDIDLGKALLQNPPLYAVSAVLIHDVIRNHSQPASVHKSDSTPPRPSLLKSAQSYRFRECDKHGITMFRTYIGASFRLYTMGMLSLDAVVRVVEKTAAAFYSIEFDSKLQKHNIAEEIMSDIAVVVDELPSHEAMVLVALLKDDLFIGNVEQEAEHARSADGEGEEEVADGDGAMTPDNVV